MFLGKNNSHIPPMSNELTDKQFWTGYWESKTDLIYEIEEKFLFSDILKKLCQKHKIGTALEIGGFPGYFSVFLKKYCNVKPTLMDFFINKDLIAKLAKTNGIAPENISSIESDIFTANTTIKYDMVFSCGLIEHFNDTKQIIEYHLPHLKENGVLFITLPNLKSLNGWVQKKFDSANYEKHNIECMDINFLSNILKELGLKNISVSYNGIFSVWLEDKKHKPLWVRAFIKTIWSIGKIISKIFPFDTKLFSPYIILIAQK